MRDDARPTLLWIDDDHHNWSALTEAFATKFETCAVESYSQGKSFWEKGPFDCVVVDLYLPHRATESSVDAYAGLLALRKILELHRAKVLVATVLSVMIPEHVEHEVDALREQWSDVVIEAISKTEIVAEGLDEFARRLAFAVRSKKGAHA
jgi:CheY-like chemotaxis protein